jgi:hypothetical protein
MGILFEILGFHFMFLSLYHRQRPSTFTVVPVVPVVPFAMVIIHKMAKPKN